MQYLSYYLAQASLYYLQYLLTDIIIIFSRYDFVGVLQWFAERVDRIILLFDANKLDISDEFRRSIEAIHGYEDKVRIILNKADQVDHHELMRVYGALMWSIAKVINVPECPKVFVGSFWDQQLKV